MSGGHFNYKEFWLGEIADRIRGDIEYNDVVYADHLDEGKYGFQLKDETLQHLQKLVKMLRDARRLVHSYDFAVCSDISEDDFLADAREIFSTWEFVPERDSQVRLRFAEDLIRRTGIRSECCTESYVIPHSAMDFMVRDAIEHLVELGIIKCHDAEGGDSMVRFV